MQQREREKNWRKITQNKAFYNCIKYKRVYTRNNGIRHLFCSVSAEMCPVSLAFTHHFQCNGFFTVSVSLALFPYEHFFFSLHTINAKSCTFSAAFAKCRTDIVVVGFLTIVFLLCIFCLPLLLCCSSFNFTFRTSHAHQYQCNWKILHGTL